MSGLIKSYCDHANILKGDLVLGVRSPLGAFVEELYKTGAKMVKLITRYTFFNKQLDSSLGPEIIA